MVQGDTTGVAYFYTQGGKGSNDEDSHSEKSNKGEEVHNQIIL